MLEQRNLQMCYHVNKPNIDAKGKKCDHVKKKKKKHSVCVWVCAQTFVCLCTHMERHKVALLGIGGGAPDR